MRDLDRREWLRLGALGLTSGAMSSGFAPLRAMGLAPGGLASVPSSAEKLLTIFLRGAIDHVYTVIPEGDSTYKAERDDGTADTVWVDPASLPYLNGSDYAVLNPAWNALLPIDAAGHIAWINRVGNLQGLRSHFTEQQIWETAFVPSFGVPLLTEGWIPRLVEKGVQGGTVNPSLSGASISNLFQRMYRSPDPSRQMAHIKSIATYGIGSADTIPDGAGGQIQLISPNFQDRLRDGVRQHLFNQPDPTKAAMAHVDATGEFMLDSEALVQAVAGYTHVPSAFPTSLAEGAAIGLPTFNGGPSFMKSCEEALQLLLNTSASFVGVEVGGWDTHSGQKVKREAQDPWLAKALLEIYNATVGQACKVHVLVISEFGRTNAANNSQGTDHGVGTTAICISECLNPAGLGTVYNCHDGNGQGDPWKELGVSSPGPYNNAIEPVRDFRAIYAELLQKRFGMSNADLDSIIPGWQTLAASGPEFAFQNFVKSPP